MRFSTTHRLPSSTQQANHPIPLPTTNSRRRPLLTAFILLGIASQLLGCAVSRHDQLKSMSGRVEKSLRAEQSRVIALTDDPTRGARLDHLSQLKYTLSAANVGLGAVPYAIDEAQRPMAYDVLEEVYSTIDWNIPLGPNDPKRALPQQFSSGTLQLNNSATPTPTPITPQKR